MTIIKEMLGNLGLQSEKLEKELEEIGFTPEYHASMKKVLEENPRWMSLFESMIEATMFENESVMFASLNVMPESMVRLAVKHLELYHRSRIMNIQKIISERFENPIGH